MVGEWCHDTRPIPPFEHISCSAHFIPDWDSHSLTREGMQHQVVCEFTSNARVRSRQLSVDRQRVNFRTSNSGFFEDNQTLPYVELGRKEGTIDKSLIYVPCKSNSLFLFFPTYTFPHTHTHSFSHTHIFSFLSSFLFHL